MWRHFFKLFFFKYLCQSPRPEGGHEAHFQQAPLPPPSCYVSARPRGTQLRLPPCRPVGPHRRHPSLPLSSGMSSSEAAKGDSNGAVATTSASASAAAAAEKSPTKKETYVRPGVNTVHFNILQYYNNIIVATNPNS